MAYPQILQDIVEFIKNVNYTASNKFTEGRRDSQVDEDQVIALLQDQFGSDVIIKEPKSRWWYDFIVLDGDKKYPVNFKSTAILSAKGVARPDNAGQKLGMLYALTTLPLEEVSFKGKVGFKLKGVPSTHGDDAFKDYLLDHRGDANRDYYYIVMNKKDTTDVLLVGLRDATLNSLKQARNAGQNLPFQIDWRLNRKLVHRTFDQAVAHIFECFSANVEARIAVLKHRLSEVKSVAEGCSANDGKKEDILDFDD